MIHQRVQNFVRIFGLGFRLETLTNDSWSFFPCHIIPKAVRGQYEVLIFSCEIKNLDIWLIVDVRSVELADRRSVTSRFVKVMVSEFLDLQV